MQKFIHCFKFLTKVKNVTNILLFTSIIGFIYFAINFIYIKKKIK